jgi:hypothetical protein
MGGRCVFSIRDYHSLLRPVGILVVAIILVVLIKLVESNKKAGAFDSETLLKRGGRIAGQRWLWIIDGLHVGWLRVLNCYIAAASVAIIAIQLVDQPLSSIRGFHLKKLRQGQEQA